mmetsp:Transcript_10075/g.27438  ORF Transcript_10075/g.27438 Transcript_10075/m.27438 type:complete len:223 (-) Transcript_10075:851-1519(-)
MAGLLDSIRRLISPDPKEVVRKWRREIRKQKNALSRDMRNLQVQQKKAEQSIRAAAKRNDEKSMRVLAKELVRSRQAVVRMLQDQGTLDALDLQMSESLRNYRLSKTFESSGRMMKEMNKLVRIDRYQETVKAMQKEMFSAGLLSEELHEGIDALDDMDVEDETEEKVQQVLDEICGETSAQAATASVPMNRVQRNRQTADEAGEDEAVEEMLAAMRAPGKA